MSKYNRTIPTISRADYPRSSTNVEKEIESSFVENLQKTAVQPKRKDDSLFDQINAVIGNKKSKYHSVEAAVEEMKKRSGLTDYLKSEADNEDKGHTKKANISAPAAEPAIFKKCPKMKDTIISRIQSSRGGLAEPAVHKYIVDMYSNECDSSELEDDSLRKYIFNLVKEERKKYPSKTNNIDIGKIDYHDADADPANFDQFDGLQPYNRNN